MAAMCRTLRHRPPRTFHEACQLMFLVLVASQVEDHGLSNYGRMDQTLWPLYEADLAAGRPTPQRALELISMMYIQLNRLVPPTLALAVIVGGLTGDGRDATNDLTYICLAARQATRLCYPTVGLAWHDQTPDALMDFAVDMLSTGIGDPAFFNDPVISRGLRAHGVGAADSHNFMNSTCVEIKTVGNSNIWVASRYFNLPAALLEVMAAEAEGTMAPAEDVQELSRRVRAVLTREIRHTADRLAGDAGRRGVRHVIETYLRRGGFELQINVVGAETLRAAQVDPESHRGLIVRVAGYSDYFTNLTAGVQDEVIRRTEHRWCR